MVRTHATTELRKSIVAIAGRMEYSRCTAFLNLLPDSRLRQGRHASASSKPRHGAGRRWATWVAEFDD
jgi:hypothetical protein